MNALSETAKAQGAGWLTATADPSWECTAVKPVGAEVAVSTEAVVQQPKTVYDEDAVSRAALHEYRGTSKSQETHSRANRRHERRFNSQSHRLERHRRAGLHDVIPSY